MTAPVRTARLQNAPAGLPAEDERLISAFFTPGTGLHARGGIWPAAAGYVGEVTLLSDTQVQTNPFRATIIGSQSAVQGDYTVVNDSVRTSTIGARDPANTRIDLLVTRIRDTGYTPNEGANDVRYAEVIAGTPAASPTAPATPANALLHGTITVPRVGGGAVTFTAGTAGWAVALGGVRPALTADTAAPAYDGQPRWHPTLGFQIGYGGAWQSPGARGQVGRFHSAADSAQVNSNTFTRIVGNINGTLNLYTGRVYRATLRGDAAVQTAGNGMVTQITIYDATAGAGTSDPAIAQEGYGPATAAITIPVQTTGTFRVATSKAYGLSPWIRRAAIPGNAGWVQLLTPGAGVNNYLMIEVEDLGLYDLMVAGMVGNPGAVPLVTA